MGASNHQQQGGTMSSRISVLLIVAILTGCAGVPAEDRQFISVAAAELAKVKNESGQWARRIKSDYTKGSSQYEAAYNKYIPAKTAVDSWLDRLGIDLTAHNDISSSKEYQAAVLDASAKAGDFIGYARGLYDKSLNKSALTLTSPIVVLLPLLTDTGLKIWDKYRAASKEDIEGVKKSLESLKWKSFDET